MEETYQSEQCGNSCECSETQSYDEGAQWLLHKAKMQLLKDKLKQRLESKYGKQLDELAELLIAVVEQDSNAEQEIAKKRETLSDKFEALFG